MEVLVKIVAQLKFIVESCYTRQKTVLISNKLTGEKYSVISGVGWVEIY